MIDDRSMQPKMLGLGCSTFGGSKSKKTALHTLHAAFDHGINYFDVARSYGYGQAESIVGEFIKGKRDKVIITSKFGITPPKPFPFMTQVKDVVRMVKKIAPGISQQVIQSYSSSHVNRPTITPRLAIETLQKSLHELGTDYLDFYLLHDCAYTNATNEDVAAALEKAKDKGMLKAWGATCENQSELYNYFRTNSPFGVVQFPYSIDNEFVTRPSGQSTAKVIFSIMSQSAGQQEPGRAFFRQLPINRIVPGLIQNLPEAWLYLASRELDQGVVLCSMTQEHHIKRNIAILNAPDISPIALREMKNNVLGRVEVGEMV